MSTPTRIYIVERVGIEAVGPRLIEATSGAAAISHIVRSSYKARAVSAKEAFAIATEHAIKPERAGAEGGGE